MARDNVDLKINLKGQADATQAIADLQGAVEGLRDALSGNFDGLATSLSSLTRVGPVVAGIAAITAVVGGLGLAFHQGQVDNKEFNNALLRTNNAAGLTVDGLRTLTNELVNTANTGYGKAEEAVLALASSGRFTSTQIRDLGGVVVGLSEVMGKEIGDVVKIFDELAQSPSKFIEKYNASMNLFTPAQQSLIRSLEEQGRTQEAANTGIQIFNEWLVKNRTQLEENKTWLDNLSEGLSNFWQKTKVAVGAVDLPIEDQLANVNKEIEQLEKTGLPLNADRLAYDQVPLQLQQRVAEQQLASLRKQAAELQQQIASRDQKAEADKAAAEASRRFQQASAEIDALGVKTTRGLEVAVQRFEKAFADLRELAPNDPRVLDPDFYNQARQQVIESNRDPDVERRAREAFEQRLADIQSQTQILDAEYTKQAELIKAQLNRRAIDEGEAARQLRDLKIKQIEDEKKLIAQRIALATQEIARTDGKNGVSQRREALAQLKVLNSQQVVIDAQYEAEVARHAKEIEGLFNKLNVAIQKGNSDRGAQVERELNRMRLSTNEAALADAEASVRSRFEQLRERTAAEFARKNASEAEVKEALNIITQQERAALEQERGYYAERLAAQQDWASAARKTALDYIDEVSSAAKRAQDVMTSLIGGFENTIYNFLQTGKFSLNDFADNFKATIDRMVAQTLTSELIQLLFGGLLSGNSSAGGGAFGWLINAFGGGKAKGGPLEPGKWYIAGERGPEPIWGGGAGAFAMGYGQNMRPAAATPTNININAVDAYSFRALLSSDARFLGDLVNGVRGTYRRR